MKKILGNALILIGAVLTLVVVITRLPETLDLILSLRKDNDAGNIGTVLGDLVFIGLLFWLISFLFRMGRKLLGTKPLERPMPVKKEPFEK
jgi:Ca2+/Na+ antiporter